MPQEEEEEEEEEEVEEEVLPSIKTVGYLGITSPYIHIYIRIYNIFRVTLTRLTVHITISHIQSREIEITTEVKNSKHVYEEFVSMNILRFCKKKCMMRRHNS